MALLKDVQMLGAKLVRWRVPKKLAALELTLF